MEWYVVGSGLIVLLIVLIVMGLPIPFALAGACLPFLWTIQSFDKSLVSLEFVIWNSWYSFILSAIPLFVFLGELISRSQIGARFYRVLHSGVPVKGAAAYGSIAACAGFGAISGSSMIGALTIGSVALPQMLRLGYGNALATGALAAGGTLSVLIPPSLVLLFYGILTETSIAKLFIAGIIPGLVLTALFMVVIFIWSKVRPSDVPVSDASDRPALLAAVAGVLPIVLIASSIIGSLYFGIATPTEAAAVAALITLILAFVIGQLTVSGLIEALKSTLSTMGYLGILLSAAMLFGFVLNYHRVPQQFSEGFVALQLSPQMVLAAVLLFYIIIGMFLEVTAIIFITIPIIYPLLRNAGFDLVWFGIIFTITMEIAVLTPPVGINLYVLQGLAPKDIRLEEVIMGALPFVAALCVLIGLLIAMPQIALWLPSQMQ